MASVQITVELDQWDMAVLRAVAARTAIVWPYGQRDSMAMPTLVRMGLIDCTPKGPRLTDAGKAAILAD